MFKFSFKILTRQRSSSRAFFRKQWKFSLFFSFFFHFVFVCYTHYWYNINLLHNLFVCLFFLSLVLFKFYHKYIYIFIYIEIYKFNFSFIYRMFFCSFSYIKNSHFVIFSHIPTTLLIHVYIRVFMYVHINRVRSKWTLSLKSIFK